MTQPLALYTAARKISVQEAQKVVDLESAQAHTSQQIAEMTALLKNRQEIAQSQVAEQQRAERSADAARVEYEKLAVEEEEAQYNAEQLAEEVQRLVITVEAAREKLAEDEVMLVAHTAAAEAATRFADEAAAVEEDVGP